MSENQKDPAAGWTHEARGVWVPPLPATAEAPSESQARSARCSVALGSEAVPIRELLRLASMWREQAASMNAGSLLKHALEACAMDLQRRAESASEREPTPNQGAAQTRRT